MEITLKEHELIHSSQAGNGFHGNCKHCNIAFVTDLGYCSWDGVDCITRTFIIKQEDDIPSDILSYARFNGLKWDEKRLKYSRPYSDYEATLEEISIIIKSL